MALNKVIKTDVFPLTLIEENIDHLFGNVLVPKSDDNLGVLAGQN